MFGSTIGVAGKDLFSDGGIYLYTIINKMIVCMIVIKWFSSDGGVLDCERVDWGVFDIILFASIGL